MLLLVNKVYFFSLECRDALICGGSRETSRPPTFSQIPSPSLSEATGSSTLFLTSAPEERYGVASCEGSLNLVLSSASQWHLLSFHTPSSHEPCSVVE